MKFYETTPRQLPSAVLIDFDNTLYPYAPAHAAGLDLAAAKANRLMGIAPDDFKNAYEKARKDINAELGETASAHSRLLYFGRMIEQIGFGAQVLYALDLEQVYWRGYLAASHLFDGAETFLDDLRLHRIPVAMITDLTVQIQFRKLIYFKLDKRFDAIVTSEEAGADKPDARMYQIALQKLSYTSGDVWAIGDHPVKDCWGAKKTCNAHTFLKHDGTVQLGKPDGVDCAFQAWADMSDLLVKLTAPIAA